MNNKELLKKELEKAIEKHPVFPEIRSEAILVMVEEYLEMQQEMLNLVRSYNDGDSLEKLREECTHLIVTATRFLDILQNKKTSPRKLIYAIDFDGTIVKEKWPEIGEPFPAAVEKIKEIQDKGHVWILNTMRTGVLLQEAVDFLFEQGLIPNVVNDNHPERSSLFKDNPRKIGADIYIDDHNCGGLCWPIHIPEIEEKK